MSFRIFPKVRFFFDGAKPNIQNRRRLKSFIPSIFAREGKELREVNFIFTSDNRIYGINKRYLGHNYFTDIITFDLSGKREPISAEIYISCDRVKENAFIHRVSFNQELQRVIFHGILHLCGYRDKTKRQMKIMRKKENDYLSQYMDDVSRDTLAYKNSPRKIVT